MKNKFMIVFAAAAALFCGAQAWAACSGLKFNANLTVTTTNPMSTSTHATITADIEKSSGSCSWFLVVSNGGASSYANRRLVNGSYTLPVQIYTDTNHTKILKSIGEASVTNDVVTGSNNQDKTFYAVLGAAAANQHTGSYSDTYTVTLYEGAINGTHALAGGSPNTKTFTLGYSVAQDMRVSLVSTNSAPYNNSATAYTVNFGSNLATATPQTMYVALWYNAGYSLTFNSSNGSKLKHSTLADTVPYTVTVNGVAKTLPANTNQLVASGSGTVSNTTTGLPIPVVFTVGSVGNARAGTYGDTITVQVTATE